MHNAPYRTTDTSPCGLRVGRTMISTSCPSALRKSRSRSTEKAPERLRINNEMRLLDPKYLAGRSLRDPALLDETVNLQCEFRLQQFLLGMGKSKVGENIAASSFRPSL